MVQNGADPVAVVTFGSAREAGCRIAGVAAAGRVIRELAEAQFAVAWIDLPAGERLDSAALADVERLAAGMSVRLGRLAPGEDVLELPGDRVVPAAALRGAHPATAPDVLRLDRADAAAEVLRRTGKPTDGPVSRWINRPVSRRLSGLLLRVPGMLPIHATLGTALLGVLMVFALASGGYWGLFAGSVLFQAASVFDGVDGEIARATFRSSRAGAALDTAIDVATNMLFVVGLMINLGHAGRDAAVLAAAWGLSGMVLGVLLLGWYARRTGTPFSFNRVKQHYRRTAPNPLVARVIAAFTVFTSRDFFILAAAVIVIAGFAEPMLYAFALTVTIWLVSLAGSMLPRRRRAAADAA